MGELFAVLILAAVLGLIPGAIARSKGRSFFLWWLFGAALWIAAMPCVILASKDQAALDRRALDAGGSRRCPSCAEVVRRQARVCRFCGRDIPYEPEAISSQSRFG